MSRTGPGNAAWRVGIGYDVHRLVEGRKLVLGGVKIAHPTGLLGHSDADVLTHAVMSALLGAMSAGSLGDHFPDSDPQYKNISSIDLLDRVRIVMEEGGWEPENVDCMVICDAPRLAAHIELMRMNLSEALRVPIECVSVKATSTEGLGYTGTGEGIAAQAICLLKMPGEETEKPAKDKRKSGKPKKRQEMPPPLPTIRPGELEGCVAQIDGASAGNPGPSGIGIVFKNPAGHVIGKLAEAIGERTNNQAEYLAAIRAAEICGEWGVRKLYILTDSELLSKQLGGSYRVKNPGILKLYKRLSEILSGFEKWKVKHVSRVENEEADRLSKAALKK